MPKIRRRVSPRLTRQAFSRGSLSSSSGGGGNPDNCVIDVSDARRLDSTFTTGLTGNVIGRRNFSVTLSSFCDADDDYVPYDLTALAPYHT